MVMLLGLSFAGIRTYEVNEEDTNGYSPLLLTCRWNFEIAQILVVASASVSTTNKRGDTPLLTAVRVGKLEPSQMFVSKGANVEAVVHLDLSGHLIGEVGTESLVRVLRSAESPRSLQQWDRSRWDRESCRSVGTVPSAGSPHKL